MWRAQVFAAALLLLVTSSMGAPARGAPSPTAPPSSSDTTPPVANAGPNQTVRQNALVTFNGTGSTDNVGIVNYTWSVPAAPGPVVGHFALPFGSIEAFDPVRPYVYVANATELGFVNLTTGGLEKTSPFTHTAAWPMSMSVSPKGNYLVVGIPTGERGYYYFGPYQGYLAGFNLATKTEVGEVSVAADIYDVAATDDGYAVVSGGSGQWAPIQVVSLKSGSIVGTTQIIWEESSIAMHPNGTRVYSVDGYGIGPANFHRYDFTSTSGVTTDIGGAYFASEGGGDLWVGPDRIVASNGKVQLTQDSATGDTTSVAQLNATSIGDAAFDPSLGLYAVADGATLEFYDHDTNGLVASIALASTPGAMIFAGHTFEAIVGGTFVTIALPDMFLYSPTPSLVFPNAGMFRVRLTVWDAAGNFGTATVTITVLDTTPPHADAGPNQTVIHGLPVTLDGSRSTDNVGITSYMWTFVDGGPRNLSGAVVTYTFQNLGTYLITLHVMDAAGNQNSSTTNVSAVHDYVPPVANAGPGGTIYPGMHWTFNGSESTDNVGIASYEWTFDDNGTQVLHGVTASYRFETAGDFTVALTVFDLDGNSGTSTTVVRVTPVPLVEFAHLSTDFMVGVPLGWAAQSDVSAGNGTVLDVLATGTSLGRGAAGLFVISGNESVQETDPYLLSQAQEAISLIQAKDPTAAVVESPHIIATADTRAAVFAVSLSSGAVYEVWGIAVSGYLGRMWVVVGAADMSDFDTYRAVFGAVITSFWVLPPPPPAPPVPIRLVIDPLAFSGSAASAGIGIGVGLAWLLGRRRRITGVSSHGG